jgi:hypothetical protein
MLIIQVFTRIICAQKHLAVFQQLLVHYFIAQVGKKLYMGLLVVAAVVPQRIQ